jgi:hypothetical protein
MTRSRWAKFAIDAEILGQIAIWLGLVFCIASHANPRGDGLEWVAVAPATVLLVAGIAIPLIFRVLGRLLLAGMIIGGVGVALGAVYCLSIVNELH